MVTISGYISECLRSFCRKVIGKILFLPTLEVRVVRPLFALYPKLKEAYDIVNRLRAIFRSKNITREVAMDKLHDWYKDVAACTLREIKSARDAIKDREDNVLNYFINCATNAAAESLNSKLKSFRAQVRGVSDLPFFMYRVCNIYG